MLHPRPLGGELTAAGQPWPNGVGDDSGDDRVVSCPHSPVGEGSDDAVSAEPVVGLCIPRFSRVPCFQAARWNPYGRVEIAYGNGVLKPEKKVPQVSNTEERG